MAFVSGRRLAQLLGIVALGALATGCTTTKPATDAKGAKLAYAAEPKDDSSSFFSPIPSVGLPAAVLPSTASPTSSCSTMKWC